MPGGSTLNETRVRLRDGMRILLRPLKVEDAALYPDFIAEVTGEDLRLRFFAPMSTISPELVDKLIHYDPKHAMAFAAIDEESGRLLGVVRLHDDPNGREAEFAVLVRSKLKGHGLGWILMKHMIAYAQERDLEAVHGEVLPENATMLTMCAELGFHVADDPDERGVKRVTLPLAEVPTMAAH